MSWTSRSTVVAGALSLLVLTGCGTARVVHRTQTGGTLALEGIPARAMEAAHRKMRAHCDGSYSIVEEKEEVVGRNTEHDTLYIEGAVLGGSSSRDAKEMRITYVCDEE